MKVIIIWIIIILTFINLSCSKTNKLKCFNDYINEIKKDKEYNIVRQGLYDTLNSWINRGLYELQYYKVHKPNWKIDNAVFFNKNNSKCLLIILIQDSRQDNIYDYSKIVAAEKINNIWNYYYVSYAINHFSRKLNNNEKISLNYLSAATINNIINDGYVLNDLFSCHINYNYIDGSDLWFNDWRRVMHQNFLKGILPKDKYEKNFDQPNY